MSILRHVPFALRTDHLQLIEFKNIESMKYIDDIRYNSTDNSTEIYYNCVVLGENVIMTRYTDGWYNRTGKDKYNAPCYNIAFEMYINRQVRNIMTFIICTLNKIQQMQDIPSDITNIIKHLTARLVR